MAPYLRALYTNLNIGVEALDISTRWLHVYLNIGVEEQALLLRSLGIYTSIGVENLTVLLRALYEYLNITNDPPFPYLESIDPTHGPAGTLVTLHGDGFNSTQSSQQVQLKGQVQAVSSWAWKTIEITIQPGSTSGYIRVYRPSPTPYYSQAKFFRVELVQIDGSPFFEVRLYDESGNLVKVIENAQ